MKQTVKDGQTLSDIAIQEYGSWEAAIAVAQENRMSVTDVPKAGEELIIPDQVCNKTMQDYCRNNDVSPATARSQAGNPMGIFTEQFTKAFT